MIGLLLVGLRIFMPSGLNPLVHAQQELRVRDDVGLLEKYPIRNAEEDEEHEMVPPQPLVTKRSSCHDDDERGKDVNFRGYVGQKESSHIESDGHFAVNPILAGSTRRTRYFASNR
jgi:hypothetical protein